MKYSFEDLEVWKKSREIRNVIFKMVKLFPKIESQRLSDKMIRSSRAIGDMIAQGFGKVKSKENIKLCQQSRGEAMELLNHLITAHDCNYIEEFTFNKNREEITSCIGMINGYVKYLRESAPDQTNNIDEAQLVREINRSSLEAAESRKVAG